MTQKLLLLLAGMILGLAAVEALLRVEGIGYEEAICPDSDRGWALRPNAIHWDRGLGEFLRINSEGLRDREHSRKKPPGTWRLAVLGDSFAQGREARLEEIFPRLLERRLSHCPALANPEVINFGVTAYGTAQELLTLQLHVWDYDPDAVLLAFYEGNDVADDDPRLATQREYRPYFTLDAAGRLIADFGFRDSEPYRFECTRIGSLRARFKRHIRVWQVASRAMLLLRTRWSTPAAPLLNDREMGMVPAMLAPPRDAVWNEAWKVTEAILLAMRDEVDEHRRRFFVFGVSSPIQVNPDLSERQREAEALGVPDLLYPERRLIEFAARNRIRFFSLVEEMQRVAERDHVFLHGLEGSGHGFFHWNSRGHALAADLLSARICSAVQGNS